MIEGTRKNAKNMNKEREREERQRERVSDEWGEKNVGEKKFRKGMEKGIQFI